MLILGISVCFFEDENSYVSCRRGCHCRKGFRVMALGWPLCCCQREILEKYHPLCLYTQPFAAYRIKIYLLSFALLSPLSTPSGLWFPHTRNSRPLVILCLHRCSSPGRRERNRAKSRFLTSSALIWPLLGSSCYSRLSALWGSSDTLTFCSLILFRLSVSCRDLISLSFVSSGPGKKYNKLFLLFLMEQTKEIYLIF